VLPGEYLPLIWGGELSDENAFESIEEANATLSLIIRHWNAIASELEIEGVHVPLVFQVETGAVPGRE
jgi:yecA family protein